MDDLSINDPKPVKLKEGTFNKKESNPAKFRKVVLVVQRGIKVCYVYFFIYKPWLTIFIMHAAA